MSNGSASSNRAATTSLWLLAAYLIILWIGGGASRADVLGQTVVRFFGWAIVVVAILALPRVEWRNIKGPTIILGAAIMLLVLQLVPLPASLWTALPGRVIFAEAALLSGTEQPWRPMSISPSGTSNALASMIVPGAVLLLAANLTAEQHWRIALLTLGLVGAAAFLGLLQVSGANFDNPLINVVSGDVSGNFANRNHFALFLAIGCVLNLCLAIRVDSGRWKLIGSFGILLLFLMMILATGSRTGVVVGLLGILIAGFAVSGPVSQRLKDLPRKAAASLVFSAIGLLAVTIWLTISFNRAASIDRVVMGQAEGDLRWRIWSVTLEMIHNYIPFGSGFGTFDPVFRIAEPDHMLQYQYVNLSHNDWIQILLEGGIFGAVLLITALVWLVFRSLKAWKGQAQRGPRQLLARVASINITLVLVASMTDYPSRTPMVMAVLALSAAWLAKPSIQSAS